MNKERQAKTYQEPGKKLREWETDEKKNCTEEKMSRTIQKIRGRVSRV